MNKEITQISLSPERDCPECGGPVYMFARAEPPPRPAFKFLACGSCGKKIFKPRGRTAPVKAELSQGRGPPAPAEEVKIHVGEIAPPITLERVDKGERESEGGAEKQEAQQQPQPEPPPPPPPPAQPGLEAVAELLWALIKPRVDEALANVKAAGGKAEVTHEWKMNGAKVGETKGAIHPAMKDLKVRVEAGLKNLLMVGPSGSGKTKLAFDLAAAMGLPIAAVSCTAGMPEWHLTGRSMPSLTTGESVFQASAFLDVYENGGVGFLDEIDAADPNTLLVVNAATGGEGDSARLSIPARVGKPFAQRHPNFILVAAANTWGTGASRRYVGRNQLDASTLSRFACGMVEVDYDKKLEAQIIGDEPASKALAAKFWKMREHCAKLGMQRILGTRELLRANQLLPSMGTGQVLDAVMAGWTIDEISKAMSCLDGEDLQKKTRITGEQLREDRERMERITRFREIDGVNRGNWKLMERPDLKLPIGKATDGQ